MQGRARMPKFTREDIERQRDAAIDIVVLLVERLLAAESLPKATEGGMQAAMQRLKTSVPALEDDRPESTFVLEAVVTRLLARGSIH
jgi:hypothetical protein